MSSFTEILFQAERSCAETVDYTDEVRQVLLQSLSDRSVGVGVSFACWAYVHNVPVIACIGCLFFETFEDCSDAAALGGSVRDLGRVRAHILENIDE